MEKWGREGGSGLEMGFGRNHLPVEDTDDSEAIGLQAIENYVFAMLVTMKGRADCIAGSPHPRILG